MPGPLRSPVGTGASHFRHGSLYELGEHRAQVFGEELHSGAFSGKAPDFGFLIPVKMAQGSGETTVSVMLISASGSSRLCWPGEKLQSVVSYSLPGDLPLLPGLVFSPIATPEILATLCIFTGLENQLLGGD